MESSFWGHSPFDCFSIASFPCHLSYKKIIISNSNFGSSKPNLSLSTKIQILKVKIINFEFSGLFEHQWIIWWLTHFKKISFYYLMYKAFFSNVCSSFYFLSWNWVITSFLVFSLSLYFNFIDTSRALFKLLFITFTSSIVSSWTLDDPFNTSIFFFLFLSLLIFTGLLYRSINHIFFSRRFAK